MISAIGKPKLDISPLVLSALTLVRLVKRKKLNASQFTNENVWDPNACLPRLIKLIPLVVIKIIAHDHAVVLPFESQPTPKVHSAKTIAHFKDLNQ